MSASGIFTVNQNGFTDPDGNPWIARGLNVDEGDALSNLQGIEQNYPGLTMIRLVCNGSTTTVAELQPIVAAYTAKGIVVQIEDHADSDNGDNTGWYSSVASAFKSNPFVFLETPNEPPASEAGQDQINIINAIRATGFANPVGVQPIGGWDFTAIPTVTAAVGTNQLYVTPHIYYNGTDPNGAANYFASDEQLAKADGLYPLASEFGNAEDGTNIDPEGNTVITAAIAANETGAVGALFWAAGNGYHANGADSAFLNPQGTALTSAGQELQPWLSQPYTPPTVGGTGSSGGSGGTSGGSGSTGSGGSTGGSGPILIAPGKGSFTDAAGNVYTIDTSGNAIENGQAITGGSGTGAMEYANGVVYAQDSQSGTWYTWSSTTDTFTQASSPPPAVTGTGTGSNPPPPPTPSPDNTVILATKTGASITDNSGNVWTIANGVVDENGQAAGQTANVVELAWEKGIMWQENSSNDWWQWTGTGWSGGGGTSPVPPTAPTPSPDNTVILATQAGASIVDSSGNTWTISNGVVDENGKAAAYSADVTELAFENGVIWQENLADNWWKWQNNTWTGQTTTSPVPSSTGGNPPPPPPPTPSPDNTVILATQAGASIVDSSGNTWTLAKGVVEENGKAAGYSAGVTEVAFEKGVIWQENSAKNWWEWNGTTWTGQTKTSPVPSSTSNPPPPPPPPTPSPDNTVIMASQAGASIVDNSGNTWTLVNGVVDENGKAAGYSAGVTEVAWEKGAIWQENSAKNWWEWNGTTWTGQTTTSPVPSTGGGTTTGGGGTTTGGGGTTGTGTGTGTNTPPAPAAAVGYDTETLGPGINVGSNWQLYNWGGTNTSQINWTQNADGSVTIAGGGNTYNGQLVTGALENGKFTGEAFGGGLYAQATLSDTGPTYNTYGNSADNGWASFWGNTLQGYENTGTNFETDIMEQDGWNPGQYLESDHLWPIHPGQPGAAAAEVTTGSAISTGTNLNAEHTYGMLWVPATATTGGYIKEYFDGSQVGATVTWNENDGSAWSKLDGNQLLLMLGTGSNSPMTVNNVQVWQASAADDVGVSTATASTAAATTTASSMVTPAAAPVTAITDSTAPTAVTMTTAETSATTVPQSDIVLNLAGGNNVTFLGGSSTINAVGNNALTDEGGKNTIVLGSGNTTLNSAVLTNGDTLDLSQTLKATSWDGLSSDLSNYMQVVQSGTTNGQANDLVQIRTTATGSYNTVATIDGAGSLSLKTFLAHATT